MLLCFVHSGFFPAFFTTWINVGNCVKQDERLCECKCVGVLGLCVCVCVYVYGAIGFYYKRMKFFT